MIVIENLRLTYYRLTASSLRYVLTYAPELTNNEAGNSKYVLTLIVNEVLSLLMNGLYEAF